MQYWGVWCRQVAPGGTGETTLKKAWETLSTIVTPYMILSISPLNIDEIFHTLILLILWSISQTEGIEGVYAAGSANFKAIN